MSRTRSVTDSLGRSLEIPTEPQRIISLCPSQTETLFALGLGERIVGRTRYCIQPKGLVEKVPVVGGTKKIDFNAVEALQPDLIIAQMEENPKEEVERLSALAPVYVTRVESFAEALESLHRLGDITGTAEQAAQLVREIEAAFAEIDTTGPPLRVLYLIWRNPYMAAGRQTYIDSVLARLGWKNEAATLPGRYPTLTNPEQLQPQLVLLSDEPFPFSEKHFPEIQRLWPQAEVRLVRGDYFSWYGSRMKEAAAYFKTLLKNISPHKAL